MVSSSSTRTKVFISYSHKDAKYLDQLVEHLAYYERNNLIETWSDKKITAGAQWREEIKRAIDLTKVAVLLISPSFLASKFIAEDELPPLLHAAKKEGAIILPVIVRSSNFEDTELANFQAVNSPSMPVAKMKGYQRDELWTNVVRKISKAVAPQQVVEEMSKQSVEKKATHELPTEPEKQIQQMVNARASFTIAHELAHRGFQTTDAVLGTTDKTEQERRALTPLRRENAQNLTILDDFWSQVNDSLKDYPALGNLQKYYRLAYNPLVPWTHLVWESQASLLQLEDEKVISRMYELNQNLDIFVMLRKKIQNVFDTDENKKLWNDLITWMKAYYGDDVKQREDAQWGAAGRELDRRAFQFSDSLTPLWNEINTLYHTIHSLGNPIP